MDTRAEFEASVRATWPDSFIFERGRDGFYVDETLAGMWWAWKARHQALEGEPVGEVRLSNPRFISWYVDSEELVDDQQLYTHPASAVVSDAPVCRREQHYAEA